MTWTALPPLPQPHQPLPIPTSGYYFWPAQEYRLAQSGEVVWDSYLACANGGSFNSVASSKQVILNSQPWTTGHKSQTDKLLDPAAIYFGIEVLATRLRTAFEVFAPLWGSRLLTQFLDHRSREVVITLRTLVKAGGGTLELSGSHLMISAGHSIIAVAALGEYISVDVTKDVDGIYEEISTALNRIILPPAYEFFGQIEDELAQIGKGGEP